MKEDFYFSNDRDLKRCSIWQVIVIALLHKLLFFRKYCYMQRYPSFSELLAAYLAHKSFRLYNLALAIRRYISGRFKSKEETVESAAPAIAIHCDTVLLEAQSVDIEGFAASTMKITAIEIYVDEAFVGDARRGLNRPDVAEVYPGYQDSASSGFCFYKPLDVPFRVGLHTVSVKAITEGGHFGVWSTQVEIAERRLTSSNIYCDTAILTFDVIDISGWAASPEGIKEVDVFIDGVFVDKAVCGVKREAAVRDRFPCYKGSENAGFCLFKTLEEPLAEGQHTIKLHVRTNNGRNCALEIVREVAEDYESYARLNPTFFTSFDMLFLTCEVVKVRGWIVTPSGLNVVKLFMDGNYIGHAKIGNRNDIKARYPCYKHTERIFIHFDKIFETPLSTDRHVLMITALANDGQTKSWDFEYESIEEYALYLIRTAPEALIALDKAEMSLDFVEVRGWALSPDGIDRVEVHIDNEFIGAAYYGFERGEMVETFPLYMAYKDGVNCGFCLYKKLDKALSAGYHTMRVEAISKTGLTKAMYEYNYVNRPYKQPLYEQQRIILSCDKLSITSHVIEAEGWASSPDGISSIEFYVDDVYIGKAFHGISTKEIGGLLPCYKDSSNSGFVIYNAYENNFSVGDHTVTLKIISDTGLVRLWSTQYYISDSYMKYLEITRRPPRKKIRGIIDEFSYRPKISVITPVYNVSPCWLDKCIQ
ncbi:MAG: hypothetical protein L7F77_00530, partial [Candidatus Magnetominusculus sp. LBB02]|nr:hypothetical protein [Candidatus Magnetominusculus sp. LBB02]